MHHLTLLLTTLLFLTLTTAQNKTYLGFNSGATLPSRSAKKQSDFETEFKTAQSLSHSPGLFNSVRLYTNIQASTDSTPIEAFPAAIATNTSILLGIWCSGTTTIDKEISALKTAIEKYGDSFTRLVLGISVGSEDLYRVSESGIRNKAGLGKSAKDIISFISQVRTALASTPLSSIPVGHVDTWSAWTNTSNSAVIDAVDFLGTDLYPYYEDDKDNGIENSKGIFDSTLKNVTSKAKGKEIWITETGWPVSGPTVGKAVASDVNAKAYWDQVGCGLFGRRNVWWYTLRDSNPDNEAKFAVSAELSSTPTFNLTCPADAGAPAAVNLEEKKGGAAGRKTESSSRLFTGAAVLLGAIGYFL